MNHDALPLDALAGLTVLGAAPFLLVMTTAFVRIVVVLSLVRSAIGAPALPPNAALTSLALVLTFVVMWPTFTRVSHEALEPYAAGRMKPAQTAVRAFAPLRAFMLRQTHAKDLALFERLAREPHRAPAQEPPAP